MKGKKHTIRKLIIGLIVLLVVLYAGVVAMVCIREGSVLKTVPAADEYDAIVVLGAQVKPDGSPSIQLSWRLDAAWEAWEQKHVPVVVCGAQGKDEPMPEAEAMSLYLENKGVPAAWAVPANRNTGSKITPGKRWHGSSTGPGSTCICRWSKR